jgi:PAS domain S-box-containing protein
MPGLKPISILLADSSSANRYAIGRMLLRAGYQIVEAITADQALELAREKPDLIILGANLATSKNIPLTRQLKSDPETLFIPLLQIADRLTATEEESAADGFILQPFEYPVVASTVRTVLRMHAAEENARALSSQWQATFDAISDGIWLLDMNGDVVRCNAALAQALEISPDDARGQHASNFVQDVSDLLPQSWHPRSTLTAPESAPFAHREITFGNCWFQVSTNLIGANTASPIGLVQVFRDITAQKKIEAARLEIIEHETAARRELEIASRMKDDFLATLSHELRTPLHSMLGWLDLLRKNEVPAEKISHALATVERSALSQVRIINDLLDVSRAIAGKLLIEREKLDLVQVVQLTVESFAPQAKAKNIEVQMRLGAQPVLISGDAGRLQQIISTLLSNAIKFTPASGSIEVRLEDNDGEVKLHVTDSGKGIDPRFLPHVFERFRQADSTSTRSQGGLGLGLAIVQHLTEAHDGTIEASSAGENQGATFTVCFPRLQTLEDNRSTPTEPDSEKASDEPPSSAAPDALCVLPLQMQSTLRQPTEITQTQITQAALGNRAA